MQAGASTPLDKGVFLPGTQSHQFPLSFRCCHQGAGAAFNVPDSSGRTAGLTGCTSRALLCAALKKLNERRRPQSPALRFLGVRPPEKDGAPFFDKTKKGYKTFSALCKPSGKIKKCKNTPCISPTDMLILVSCLRETGVNIRVWRSLVSRLNGVQEAAGSSPVTRTKPGTAKRSSRFFVFLPQGNTASLPQRLPLAAQGQRSGGAARRCQRSFLRGSEPQVTPPLQ